MKRDESKWNVFGIGIECCGPARVEGSWHTGKGEGVLGRAAVGGVTKGFPWGHRRLYPVGVLPTRG